MLLLELGEYERAKKLLKPTLDLIHDYHLPRAPHWFSLNTTRFDMADQIDGEAHIILAFAKYCAATGDKEFEDTYYPYAAKSIVTVFSEPYFVDGVKITAAGGDWDRYENWSDSVTANGYTANPDALNLIHNFCFEHTRDYHFWDCYDFLAQSFTGAAADAMLEMFEKRGKTQVAAWMKEKIKAHRMGMRKNFTFVENGKTMYYEMLVAEGDKAVPYPALGWPLYGGIGADWKGIDPVIFRDTLDYLNERTMITDPISKTRINMMEYDPAGRIFPSNYTKMVAWAFEYFMSREKWDNIAEWFKFFSVNYPAAPITEIVMPIGKNGEDLIVMANVLFEGDIPEDIKWKIEDGGSAEQNIWFCRAINRMIKALGV